MPLPSNVEVDSLKAYLSFDTSSSPLPLGVTSERFATFEISGEDLWAT